jgi:hypothetical protein
MFPPYDGVSQYTSHEGQAGIHHLPQIALRQVHYVTSWSPGGIAAVPAGRRRMALRI